jgi:hypothetical protein
MKRPNLFIVGAAKSGTSSLWQYFRQNPQVYMPEDELYKEPCYFSAYGEKMGLANYLKIFEKAGDSHRYVGEASAVYLTDPSSAKRLFDYNPDARIIIMLRNPADRAYSLYNWMVQDGYEYANSFEDALDLEEERQKKQIPNWYEPQYYWNYMYFHSGLYCEQVRNYLDLFRESVLIIKFDEFKSDLSQAYKKVCSFLQIDVNEVSAKIYNPSRAVFSPRLQFILRKINSSLLTLVNESTSSGELENRVRQHYKEYLSKLSQVTSVTLPEKIRGKIIIRRVVSRLRRDKTILSNVSSKEQRDQLLTLGFSGRPLKVINGRTRTNLLNGYAQDIERLSNMTHIDFTSWLRQPSTAATPHAALLT